MYVGYNFVVYRAPPVIRKQENKYRLYLFPYSNSICIYIDYVFLITKNFRII